MLCMRAHADCSRASRHETVALTVTSSDRRTASGGMQGDESGLGEECGVFGCVAAGEWPTQLEVAQVLTLGLVALQHR